MNLYFSPSEIAISSASIIVGLAFLHFFIAPLLGIYTRPIERISALILALYILIGAGLIGVIIAAGGVWWFSHA